MCVLKGEKMFGEYLRTERKKAKLSQQTLADKITSLGYKCSNGLISYYETGYGKEKHDWSNRPPEKFLEYLAQALGLSVKEAREKAGYSSENPLTPELERNWKQLLEGIAHLPLDQQEQIKQQFEKAMNLAVNMFLAESKEKTHIIKS